MADKPATSRGPSPRAAVVRVLARVEPHDTGYGTPCWLFTGPLNVRGYGKVSSTQDGRPVYEYVHRVVWAAAYGPLQTGVHLDHLCNVGRCVNPVHLEPVTIRENNRRAQLRRIGGVASWLQSDEARFYGAELHPEVSAASDARAPHPDRA